MPKHQPSGAAKRKKRAEAKKSAEKSRKVLEGFFRNKPRNTDDNEEKDEEAGDRASPESPHSNPSDDNEEINTDSEEHGPSLELSEESITEEDATESEVMKEAAEPELEPVITNHDFGYIQPGKLKEKLIAAIIAKGSVYFQNTEHKALFPKEIFQKKKRSLTSFW